ncbi:MAG: GIY-YIG nuclease family protein [Candidatus Yanofskybacteria bacterium]|nr:GIY-YIG nuclease family protein [Candidatus Yanofskybacteria bacterium]
MTFYFVYVLQSLNKDFIYVGFTTDLERRFKEHNDREELSTKHYAPFDLIHYEAYKSKIDAHRREEYLKTTKGKTTSRTMLKDSLM